MSESIYDFECNTIDEEPASLSQYQGKVMLICNTASYCGFTPQYTGLEELHKRYHDQGFTVLGFPSNTFGEDPRSNENIHSFCVRNYGVSFPLFTKISVNGEDEHPIFAFLKEKQPGFLGSQKIKWNFTKFLVDREGQVISRHSPSTFPSRLRKNIESLL